MHSEWAGYPSRWAKYRHRPTYSGVVNSPRIPAELGVNRTWIGVMNYEAKLSEARQAGQLYVGVIASHASGQFLVWVPPPRSDIPTGKIAWSPSQWENGRPEGRPLVVGNAGPPRLRGRSAVEPCGAPPAGSN